MLDFAIFAVTFIVVLIIAVIYIYPSSRKISTVPCLDKTSDEDGNLADIQREGSLHQFLLQKHASMGPIISFWIGDELVVSAASPSLLKHQINVFDSPGDLYGIMNPVFGSSSIIFKNGAEGRSCRQLYDKSLHRENLRLYSGCIQKVSSDMCSKWLTFKNEEHLGLAQYMTAFATQTVLRSVMGVGFFSDDREVLAFKRNYNEVWMELETRGREWQIPKPGSQRDKQFEAALQELRKSLTKAVEMRRHERKEKKGHGDDLLVDHFWVTHNGSMDSVVGECLAYIITGISRTASLLTWCLYFLANNPEVQEKLFNELPQDFKVLGDCEPENIFTLKYLRQVLEETLRCAVIVPWTSRVQDFDSELGGHKIPKQTAVIQALGVIMQDEKLFPEPNKFDPNRFTSRNSKEQEWLAFSPFGFAGKRSCPARDWTYLAAGTLVATLVSRLTMRMVEGQVVVPVYGLVTTPMDEVWVTVHKRNIAVN